MPEYAVENRSCWIYHHTRMVDTNVIVAYFDPDDKHHESAKTFLDYLAEQGHVPLIPLTVIVEAWGVCPEKYQHSMIEWLAQPGNVILLPEDSALYSAATLIATKFKTDIVDALLIQYAKVVTDRCALPKPLPIVTFDNRNWHIWEHMQSTLVYWNPESDEPYF